MQDLHQRPFQTCDWFHRSMFKSLRGGGRATSTAPTAAGVAEAGSGADLVGWDSTTGATAAAGMAKAAAPARVPAAGAVGAEPRTGAALGDIAARVCSLTAAVSPCGAGVSLYRCPHPQPARPPARRRVSWSAPAATIFPCCLARLCLRPPPRGVAAAPPRRAPGAPPSLATTCAGTGATAGPFSWRSPCSHSWSMLTFKVKRSGATARSVSRGGTTSGAAVASRPATKPAAAGRAATAAGSSEDGLQRSLLGKLRRALDTVFASPWWRATSRSGPSESSREP